MNTNYTRSLFLERLIPQFVREEYPLFVSFLKSYYDYLDRSTGQLIAVVIGTQGSNYSSPTINVEIIDNRENSTTFSEYIRDYKGATFQPYVTNGKLEKILVLSYGADYTSKDQLRFIISDPTGSGAEASPVIVESQGELNQAVKNSQYARDIDNEVNIFTNFLINEYVPKFPKTLYTSNTSSVELNKFIKFIRQFYHSVGIEDSISFLYRILFNTSVKFYYPKTDMLRIDDGKWYEDEILNVQSTQSDMSIFIGHRIIMENGTTAIIDNVQNISGTLWMLYLTAINGNFSGTPENFWDYPVTGKGQQLGNSENDGVNGIFYKANGQYIGNDGQLDTTKVLQDDFYYQDFSYELQSEETIRSFKGLLEDLVHPAGLIYFIRLNLESALSLGILEADPFSAEVDILNYFPDSLELNLSENAKCLGPTFQDIDNFKCNGPVEPYINFSGTLTVVPSQSYTVLDLSASPYFPSNYDEYVNFSLILTDTSGTYCRTVTAYDGSTKEITLDSAFVPASTPIGFTLIQNFWIAAFDPSGTLKLSSLDPNFSIPYSPVPVSTLAQPITDTSSTSIDLNLTDTFNLIKDDVIQIDSEQLILTKIVGASGVFTLEVVRGGSPDTHVIGSTAFNCTDHRFHNWNIFITSGPGAGTRSKITGYQLNGATGIINFSPAFS